MRITSGIYGSRTIDVPKSDSVRPTQDRVREALFSMLAQDVPGARFLDLFAGSGAVGLEAISRGAKFATFVEADGRHLKTIAKNVDTLKVDKSRCSLARANVYAWLQTFRGEPYSIIFADPPYALAKERGFKDVLDAIARQGVLAPGGIFIAETDLSQAPETVEGWELLRDRAYGKTRIAIYRRNGRQKES